jgi:hypothetical protein
MEPCERKMVSRETKRGGERAVRKGWREDEAFE